MTTDGRFLRIERMAKAERTLPDVEEQLRRAIRNCGKSLNELAEATGVHQAQTSRFLRKKRTLTLKAAAKLCAYLGLRLVGPGRGQRPCRTLHPDAARFLDGE